MELGRRQILSSFLEPKFIEIDLMDGHTSDGIRVSYDFELNG